MTQRHSMNSLVELALNNGIKELMPWDLEELLEQENPPLLLDVREPHEFNNLYIPGSIHVPRGVLETACDYDYDTTVPELVNGRDRAIIVICRSGNRSVLAAQTLQLLGFTDVTSLKTGIKGWNDAELAMINGKGEEIDADQGDEFLIDKLRDDQKSPIS